MRLGGEDLSTDGAREQPEHPSDGWMLRAIHSFGGRPHLHVLDTAAETEARNPPNVRPDPPRPRRLTPRCRSRRDDQWPIRSRETRYPAAGFCRGPASSGAVSCRERPGQTKHWDRPQAREGGHEPGNRGRHDRLGDVDLVAGIASIPVSVDPMGEEVAVVAVEMLRRNRQFGHQAAPGGRASGDRPEPRSVSAAPPPARGVRSCRRRGP